MDLRSFRPGDAPVLYRLFYDTVHTVCAGDYTPAQLDAWVPEGASAAAWNEPLRSRTTLVAGENGVIPGFDSIGPDGYPDLLCVHKGWQRRGQVLANYMMEKELI